MDSKRLKDIADKFIDSEEFVLSGELFLLRKVYEAAIDVKEAKQCREFRDRHPNTDSDLIKAVSALDLYFSEFE